MDWPCEVKTLFREENLGCKYAVSGGINWFFGLEEQGIVLEDDCLPSQSFFWFCEDLLGRYKDDDRVGMIAGTNHISYRPKGGASYLFSKNKACWGWATWRRSWLTMDFEMAWRKTVFVDDVIANMGITRWRFNRWWKALEAIDTKQVDAWDWHWYFSKSVQNQLSIFPEENLVANIGFGEDSTHTKGFAKRSYTDTADLVFPLTHLSVVCPDASYDLAFETEKMRPKKSVKRLVPRPIKRFIKEII